MRNLHFEEYSNANWGSAFLLYFAVRLCRESWVVSEYGVGTTFKHRIAEIHAISMKRLSKVEAADDPSDGADDE
jgi:hypothetical protein